jgi:hypothetical protein
VGEEEVMTTAEILRNMASRLFASGAIQGFEYTTLIAVARNTEAAPRSTTPLAEPAELRDARTLRDAANACDNHNHYEMSSELRSAANRLEASVFWTTPR